MAKTNGNRANRNNRKPPRRPGPHKWDTERFFEVLDDSNIIAEAARVVGVNPSTIWRRRQSDPAFAVRFEEHDEALTQKLEAEGYRRALDGSDRLIEFFLRARRPETYRERIQIDDERGLRRRREIESMDEAQLDRELAGVPDNVVEIRKAA